MVIPAGAHILELSGLVIPPFARRYPGTGEPSISLAALRVYPSFLHMQRAYAYDLRTLRKSRPRQGVPSLSITSPNTITLPASNTSPGAQ